MDIVGRLQLEGCKSFDQSEIDRCFSVCVAPECCKNHVSMAVSKGYTYQDFLIDCGVDMKSIFFDAWVVFDVKTRSIKMDPRTGALCIFETKEGALREAKKVSGTQCRQVRWAKEYIFDKLFGAIKDLDNSCDNLEYESGRVSASWDNAESVIDEVEIQLEQKP